jgi:hypothetical protein
MRSSSFFAGLVGGLFGQAALAQDSPQLATREGFELGLQVSDYRYTEPTIHVRIDGPQVGARGAYTVPFSENYFSRGELRGAYGEHDYSGSGTAEREPNFIFEARYLLGRDFRPSSGLVLAPYSGLGYRYLFNDLRGRSSTGEVGYRRYSHYFYLPIGLRARFAAGGSWVLAPHAEYAVFLGGEQYSRLTDTGLPLSDARNRQRRGNGFRAGLMFEHGDFSFGPWVNFWRIHDSDVVRVSPTRGALEPRNRTREAGIEASVRF